MAARHHGGERLADFVGYRGGKFSERRHTSDVREFRSSLMHLIFNSPCLSDIHDGPNEFQLVWLYLEVRERQHGHV